MLAQFSVLGLEALNPHLFDDMVLPAGADRQLAINTIMLENAELNVLYADPDFMQLAIQIWSRRRKPAWERMLEALNEDYNPLWNKDGTISEERTVNSSGKSNGDSVHSVQGFNSSHFSNAEKDESSGSSSGTTTEKWTRKEGGNIGVTMSQEMLKAELDVRQYDFYMIIANEFKQRFCLQVY